MVADQTKGGSSASTGSPSTGATSATKKRPRLTALTPVGILRQKKRRGGAAAGILSGRKLGASAKSGASTPTKSRSSLLGQVSSSSDGGLATPPMLAAGGGGEKRGRRASAMGLAAPSSDGAVESMNAGGSQDEHALGELTGSANDSKGKEGGPTAATDANADDDDDDDDARADAAGGDEDSISLVKQSKEEIKEMWEQLSEEQRQRYGVYRRTALNKGSVKKLVSNVLNQQISSTLTFVVAGFSKVFVGQIVESAVQIQAEWGDEGPLKPEHLREAYRLYKKENEATATSNGFTKRLF